MARMIGKNVVLREFRQEDIAGMRSWVTDSEVTKYLAGTFMRPQTWEQTEQYLGGILRGDMAGTHFVIARKDSLAYLGQCDLLGVHYTDRRAEMAIVLCAEHCGQGYGKEAVRLLLSYAFRHMNLRKVTLKVFADNYRAIRCYEKCGFTVEGCLREESYQDGRYIDILIMGILKREFSETLS